MKLKKSKLFLGYFWLSLFSLTLPSISCYADGSKCPDIPFLNENYPVNSIIISDFKDLEDKNFYPQYLKLLGEKIKGTDISLIILGPDSSKSLALKLLPKEVHRNLKHVKGKSYLWQQDYTLAKVDKAGNISLSYVQGYGEQRRANEETTTFDEESVSNLFKLLRKKGISQGEDIIPGKKFSPGNMGGNVVALPGNICIIGDGGFPEGQQDWNHFSKQVCGSIENVLPAPTEVAVASHSDEIIKLIPNNNHNPPCNFSIAVADFNLPFELLNKNKNDLFFEVDGRKDWIGSKTHVEKFEGSNMSDFCNELYNINKIISPESPSKIQFQRSTNSGTSQNLFKSFLSKAYASDRNEIIKWCSRLKNSDIVKYLKTPFSNDLLPKIGGGPDESYYDLNVKPNQYKIEEFKKKLIQKLKERLPNCSIDILPLPMMRHLSFTANSITIGNNIISPDSGKKIFNDYLKEEYKKRNVDVSFLDSTAAHSRKGNLHCMTKVLNSCK